MKDINAIDLYAKYAETFNRLRPIKTLPPRAWNDLPEWVQEVWADLANWIGEAEESGDGWQRVVFAADIDAEYKEVDGVMFARRRNQ